MNVGFLDLVLIYMLPIVFLGVSGTIFLVGLYLVVKYDWFHLDFSYDVLVGLMYRKKPFNFFNVAFLMIFDNGMQATLLYRTARWMYLHRMGQPALVLTKVGKFFTNMEVPPNSKAGRGLSLWHGTVISIGQFTDLGERCTIRQGVAISGFGKVKVGNDVSFSHGCFVIEGNPDPLIIGDGAVIAANAVVTKSVPPHHVAAGVPANKLIKLPETPVQGIIFDLDGVLTDSVEAVYRALNATLETLGYGKVSRNKVQKTRAMSIPNLLKRLLREKDLEKGTALFQENLRERSDRQVAIRDDVEETLKKLQGMGVTCSAFSRHFGENAREILKGCGLTPYVKTVLGADEFDEWKPHPKAITTVMEAIGLRKENALYVGGTAPDIRFGNNAAIRVIVLPLGGTTRKQLEKKVPRLVDNTIMDRMTELPDFVETTRGEQASSESLSV